MSHVNLACDESGADRLQLPSIQAESAEDNRCAAFSVVSLVTWDGDRWVPRERAGEKEGQGLFCASQGGKQ